MSIDETKTENDLSPVAVVSSQTFSEQEKELMLQTQKDYQNRQYTCKSVSSIAYSRKYILKRKMFVG
jgi:hypothetical protein